MGAPASAAFVVPDGSGWSASMVMLRCVLQTSAHAAAFLSVMYFGLVTRGSRSEKFMKIIPLAPPEVLGERIMAAKLSMTKLSR